MHKIYSRPRLRLPNIFENNSNNKYAKKVKKIYKLIIIIVIAFSTVQFVLNAITPVFESLCRNESKSIATIILNEESTKVMSNYEYEDLFLIDKDSNGKINLIKSNMITINEITSDIAKNIQLELDKVKKASIEIPLGSVLGSTFFTGVGPGIDITIIPIGNVVTDLKSEFIEKGVNQTIHRIYLEVECNVEIISSLDNMEEKILNQVLLMENVIIGEIPTNYYNFHGVEGNDLLEMIE